MMDLKRSPEFKRIVPIFAIVFLRNDSAIAQTQTHPQPLPAPTHSDPLTAWGIAAALVLSLGQVVVGLFKEYASRIQRKSEIELKAQESREQGDQAMSIAILEQQKAFVLHLQKSEERNMERIIGLFQEATKAQLQTAHAIEELTKEIRNSK